MAYAPLTMTFSDLQGHFSLTHAINVFVAVCLCFVSRYSNQDIPFNFLKCIVIFLPISYLMF